MCLDWERKLEYPVPITHRIHYYLKLRLHEDQQLFNYKHVYDQKCVMLRYLQTDRLLLLSSPGEVKGQGLTESSTVGAV